jgi:expansin (peptidoglycan-binding protein)
MRAPILALALGLVGAAVLGACGSDDSSSGGSDAGGSEIPRSGSDAGGGSDASSGGGGDDTGGYSTASESGKITYYDATGAGACSFDATPDDLDVAAMDAPEFDDAAVCGECVAITGPKGNLTVRVVDLCPECEKGHLDLSEEAFAKLADVSAGIVPVTWKVVECSVTGNLKYTYKDGVSQYWFALQVSNSRLPIESLELKVDGAFVDVGRESYNYFVDGNGSGPGPVTVRVTSIDGQQLIDTLPAAAANVTSTGAAQFK